jgi:hypothetical protein
LRFAVNEDVVCSIHTWGAIFIAGYVSGQTVRLITWRTEVRILHPQPRYAPVVKLVITPPCHGGGQGFESPPVRHYQGDVRMYHVDIHPWSSNITLDTPKIATYSFDNKDKAQEFLDQYNAYSQFKIAVLRGEEHDLEFA